MVRHVLKAVFTRVLVAALFVFVPNFSLADEITCPSHISISQHVTKVPKEWSPAYREGKGILSFVGFFHRDANGKVTDITPGEGGPQEVSGVPASLIYRFNPDEDDVYIGCEYEGSGTILIKKKPKKYEVCNVSVTGTPTKVVCNGVKSPE